MYKGIIKEEKQINIFKNDSNEKNVEIINGFFIKIKNIKEEINQNFDDYNYNLERIDAKEILMYINKFNQSQIESVINGIILNLVFNENLFLIKEDLDNINDIENLKIDSFKNDYSNIKPKKIKLLVNIYKLLKEIIEEYFFYQNKYTYIYLNLTSDIKIKFFNYCLINLINISNYLIKHFNHLINDFYNIFINFFHIFNLFLENEKLELLSNNQKEDLFRNNIKLLINIEKFPSDFSLFIIEKIIKTLNIFFYYFSLDSNELNEINNNESIKECLIKLKQYIIDRLNNYKELDSILTIIDFIEIINLYENRYIIKNNDDLDNSKLFNISDIEQIKELIDKKFNLDKNFNSFKLQIESIINFMKEPNKKDNFCIILKYKIIKNVEIIKLKKFLKDITDESNYNSLLTLIKKKNIILINNNELLKNCYIKIKEKFLFLYNEIVNIYNSQNNINNFILILEEKYNKLIEIMKLLKYLLITPEEENLLILINDNIFNCLISILDFNINGSFLFNDICRDQSYIIFDMITQDENILHNEILNKNIIFTNYILKEFINYMGCFKNYLNNKQQNNDTDIFINVDKIKFKKISKLICELTKEKEFLKINLHIFNFTSLYIIFLVDEIDSYTISLYINILKNYLILIQEENLYLLSNEDNNVLASLIKNIFNKYNNDSSIIIELFSLVDIKKNDEYFIKILINNNLSSIIFSIFSEFSEESQKEKNKYNSQCIFPALNTIYNLLKYNFFIIELLNIGINNVINGLNQYIFNTKICEIFLLIILKIIENKENINMLIKRINLTDVKRLVINILEKYLDTCHKNLIKYSLEVIEFFIQSPNNLINFSKSNDKNNTILMACLFKCINLNLSDFNIINLSIKILYRYISYVKINKEKSRINSLDNNLNEDEEEDDDLPDDLFSDEYPQVLKIFKCKYFKEFNENYLVKILDIYLIKQKNPEIIKNIIEIIRILITIIDSKENLRILYTAIIEVLFKFLNIFLKYDDNTKEKNNESILDLIIHFTFLSYKIISIKKEIITNNVIIIISLISIIINNFKIKIELIERFLQILDDTCTYGNKTQLIKSIKILKVIFDKLRQIYESMEIKEDKKEFIIFIFTKIIKDLSKYDLDILNYNFLFIFKNIPIQNIKDFNIISDNNKNEIEYPKFKDKLLRICCIYYMESNDEAILFLNIIKNLYNQYTSLSTDINKTNFEIRFLLCVIYDLCIKTSYLKEEIKKDNQLIFTQIKIYMNHLSKVDSNLKLAYEKCINEMEAERNYSSKKDEIIKLKNNNRIILLVDKIKPEVFDKMKLFLLIDNIIYYYTNKSCLKCKMNMDNDLKYINIKNENEKIEPIKIESISKIINDNSNQAFSLKGFFSRKTKSSNCISIYYINDKKEEIIFNIECQNEEITLKYIKYFNLLIDFDKNGNSPK